MNEHIQPQINMKTLIIIVLASLSITGSEMETIPSNHPELIDPIVQDWIHQAKEHSFEYQPRFSKIKSITMVSKITHFSGADYYQGNIRIAWNKMERDEDGTINPADLKRKVFHEIGHHYGLEDCPDCRYYMMSGNLSDRALYLYRDDILSRWIDHQYFIAIKDPQTFNQFHIHR